MGINAVELSDCGGPCSFSLFFRVVTLSMYFLTGKQDARFLICRVATTFLEFKTFSFKK